MNTPPIETPRLILRRAYESDIPALFEIYRSPEVMRFVPVFPAKDMEDMRKIYAEKWAPCYEMEEGYQYVICWKNSGDVIGYVHIDTSDDAYDLGYGVRRDWWHQGIASEAAAALVARAREDGLPYVTATHDRENPHSGGVMRKIGMTYRYSYHEQWMPKNIPVVFRLYQLDLNGSHETYTARQQQCPEWFIEEGAGR